MWYKIRYLIGGALLLPSLLLAITCLTVLYWPPVESLRTVGRILDSLVPQLLAMMLLACAALRLLGLRRLTWVMLALTLAGAAGLALRVQSWSVAAAPEATSQVTLLWFNVLSTNATPPDQLAQALIDSPADVIILAEPQPLLAQKDRLAATFPVIKGCEDAKHCNLLVLARIEVGPLSFTQVGRMANNRLVEILLPDGPGRPPLTVVGAHLVKPWFFGFAEAEEWSLHRALDKIDGPVALVGDLNAAPWSARARDLVIRCGMEISPYLVPTWPAAAGRFGVPIDQLMLRGGAQPVSAVPWGVDLGSNHIGLLMEISVADQVPQDPSLPDCALTR